MLRFFHFSLAALVIVLVLGIFDRERRRMWLSIVLTIVGALALVTLVAWLAFESEVFK